MAYKQQKFISHSSGSWEVQDLGAGRFGFWWRKTSFWFYAFLFIGSHGTAETLHNERVQSVPRPLFSSIQSLSHVRLFATPWTAARQASLSITSCWRLLRLMTIELAMPSNHLILCHPLLLLPAIFPSIWVLSNESVLHIRWPKYWSFSFSISPSNKYSGRVRVGR